MTGVAKTAITRARNAGSSRARHRAAMDDRVDEKGE